MANPNQKCGVLHPEYASYRCQELPGHQGNHQATKAGRARVWAPYLPTFHALLKPLLGGGR